MKTSLLLPLFTVTSFLPAQVPPDHAERMTKGLAMFSEVSAILKDQCVKCHGGEKTKSDLDLVTREGLMAGGAGGPVVVPFDVEASRLLKLIRHQEEPHMPEHTAALPEEVVAKIAAWIEHGAPYEAPLLAGRQPPRDKSKVTGSDRAWWAFQPLARPVVPPGAAHPVDAFLAAKAAEKHLRLNPPAAPRDLMRRLTFTVTGLPAEPEAIAAFEAAPSSAAWAAAVDRALASPAYGERWARHWLDVARFAESSGFEHDYDRPHAWHYRDFVIRALNDDVPYDRFVQWQLAGDEFAPGNAEAMMATGFLGAGVFPTQITANEVERVRYDAMDDMLATTGSAMLGLTIGCARCHDHKFDPIPAADYYRLLSTFTTTVRSNVELDIDPAASAQRLAGFRAEQERLKAELSAWESNTLRPEFDRWLTRGAKDSPADGWVLATPQIVSAGGTEFRALPDGSFLATGANPDTDKWTVTFTPPPGATALRLEALADPSMKRSGPGRADNGNFALSRIRIVAQQSPDGPAREPGMKPGGFTHQQNADHLSVAASLDDNPGSGWAVDGKIGADHAAVFVFAEPLAADECLLTVTLEFNVNTRHTIGRPRFSFATGTPPPVREAAVPAALAAFRQQPHGATLSTAQMEEIFAWWKQRDAVWRERDRRIAEHTRTAPKTTVPVMVCVEGYEPIIMHSQGPPFLPETHILKRGDTNQKTAVATQSFLQVLMREGADESRWHWTPPAGAKSSGKRRSLAGWMTDTERGAGALLARVAVNRLWQHHFGRGIVSTPADFGKTGALPSHPELLDWLAGELIRHGWQLKPVHRLILTSEAWKQSAAVSPEKTAADPDNALFLRAVPRRLEAEAARDAILAVSGQLDPTLFGPGTLDENSRRRSLYFTVKRSQLVNSMVVFDAPEPLNSQGSRPVTTVAPQALFLMNSPQVRAWSASFAARAWSPEGWESRIHNAARLALGRSARVDELAAVRAFLEQRAAERRAAGEADADQQAFTDYCQALFGLNEFLYVP